MMSVNRFTQLSALYGIPSLCTVLSRAQGEKEDKPTLACESFFDNLFIITAMAMATGWPRCLSRRLLCEKDVSLQSKKSILKNCLNFVAKKKCVVAGCLARCSFNPLHAMQARAEGGSVHLVPGTWEAPLQGSLEPTRPDLYLNTVSKYMRQHSFQLNCLCGLERRIERGGKRI
jgi:hypothetical protein